MVKLFVPLLTTAMFVWIAAFSYGRWEYHPLTKLSTVSTEAKTQLSAKSGQQDQLRHQSMLKEIPAMKQAFKEHKHWWMTATQEQKALAVMDTFEGTD